MPNKSKAKGNRFERQIVELCKIWCVKAKRAWGSNGQALGMHEEVDVLIDDDFRVQAKCRKRLPMFLKPSEEVDCTVFKEDRGDVYIMMRFEDWLAEKKRNEEK
jgi:Holliday junction resolvase